MQGDSLVSDKQVVSLGALVFAVLVAGALYLNLTNWHQYQSATPMARAASEKFDCELTGMQNPSFDADECADQVDRKYQIGPYVPWYKQQPALAALLAGSAVFVVLAGGARLFLK